MTCENEQSVVDVESQKYQELIAEIQALEADPNTNPSELLDDKRQQAADQCELVSAAYAALAECLNQQGGGGSSGGP